MSPSPVDRHLERERRKLDALQRAQELIATHPDPDPAERLHLLRTLNTINRRYL